MAAFVLDAARQVLWWRICAIEYGCSTWCGCANEHRQGRACPPLHRVMFSQLACCWAGGVHRCHAQLDYASVAPLVACLRYGQRTASAVLPPSAEGYAVLRRKDMLETCPAAGTMEVQH